MAPQQDNPQRDKWIELLLNVVAPTVVLVFLSGEDRLGPALGLVVGLSFPLLHAGWSRWRGDPVSPLSLLAVVSVVLTGGIGLLRLDARWFAVKEALLPVVMAAFTWASRYTPWPVVDTLIFRLLDEHKVRRVLRESGRTDALDPLLDRVNRWFVGCFFYSAVASYALATALVVSPTGTVAFNEEVGKFTFLSFPVVALPMTVAMGFALNSMLNGLEQATGLEVDDLLRPGLAPPRAGDSGPPG